MTPAELRAIRKRLGLTGAALAEMLGVTDRTIRRWEAGTVPISKPAIFLIGHIQEAAGNSSP